MDELWNNLMRKWWGHWCVAGFFFVWQWWSGTISIPMVKQPTGAE